MRPVDLAREAGISAQQVRNLEAADVLPFTERTDSGYRLYGRQHLHALLCYRALANGYGTVAARQIMSLVNHGEVAVALREVDSHHAISLSERQQLEETERAVEALSLHQVDRSDHSTALSTIGSLARHLGIRTSALRVWEKEGLLWPTRRGPHAHREYSATDIRDARVVHLLRQSQYSIDSIRPVIKELRNGGSTLQLQAALRKRRNFITHRAMDMLRADAALYEYISQHLEPGEVDLLPSSTLPSST